MGEAPHRILDKLLDSLAETAKGLGESAAKALDEPPKAVKGPEGVHRAVHRAVDGAIVATTAIGEGVAKALDHPHEQVGIPPKAPDLPELPKPPRPPEFRR